jgi:hypothetical protein
VIARWQRVMADGTRLDDAFRQDPGTLFETTARFCPFAIHACLVSRARVEQAGGFDTRLTVGADWDLWQRLARAGTRFVSIDDILAFYRTRPQSAGVNVPKLVESGVRLITTGPRARSAICGRRPCRPASQRAVRLHFMARGNAPRDGSRCGATR